MNKIAETLNAWYAWIVRMTKRAYDAVYLLIVRIASGR
jgi:hypothetical protein